MAELLRRGWTVEAVDAYPDMVDAARAAAEATVGADRCSRALRCVHQRLADWDAPAGSFDLVHAGFSLPFVARVDLAALWARVVRSLRPGGLFAGQFFGPNDSFVAQSPAGSMSVHVRAEVDALLTGFEVLSIAEEERDGVIGVSPTKVPKHWHVFHVIARRIR